MQDCPRLIERYEDELGEQQELMLQQLLHPPRAQEGRNSDSSSDGDYHVPPDAKGKSSRGNRSSAKSKKAKCSKAAKRTGKAEEAQEGKNAFLEKRDPDFQQFPKFPG